MKDVTVNECVSQRRVLRNCLATLLESGQNMLLQSLCLTELETATRTGGERPDQDRSEEVREGRRTRNGECFHHQKREPGARRVDGVESEGVQKTRVGVG